jgi:pyruvate/2-oxoglutarate dehydrogenase complex dihydrolipoamide dehydrogenase (E3) component
VIGAGPAGEVCSARLAAAGLRTACVERELVAGECSYWGCMPSKTMLRPPEALAAARRAPGADAAVSGELDVAAVLAWRDFMVDDWDDTEHAEWLDEKNVELLRGDAEITGPGRLEVDGEPYEAERIVIATGSAAAIPPIEGLRELEGVWTNRGATEVKEIPGSLVILGGGPVGAEMAQAFARMGASVSLVEAADRLLPGTPVEACSALTQALEEDGIELRTGVEAKAAGRSGGAFKLDLGDGDTVEGEKLLVATGRKPRIEGLGLDSVGIEPGPKGIEVDARMRAAEGVWAIGDVTGVALLTHVGKYQARIAAADIRGEEPSADYRAIPSIVFTDPQVAVVGDTENAEQSVTVKISSTARNSTYYRDAKKRPGFLTLYTDGERLTGACLVGPEAGEWLGQATLAIRAKVPLAVLRDTIQPFPTFSELYQTALDRL